MKRKQSWIEFEIDISNSFSVPCKAINDNYQEKKNETCIKN